MQNHLLYCSRSLDQSSFETNELKCYVTSNNCILDALSDITTSNLYKISFDWTIDFITSDNSFSIH